MERNNSVNYDVNKLLENTSKSRDVCLEYINLLKIVKLIDRILFNTYEETIPPPVEPKSAGLKRSKTKGKAQI